MHFYLMVMSASLATAVLATPIVKKRDASSEDLDLISIGPDGSVDIGR